MIQRIVRAELLDSLPHSHPDAQRNRRELRTINSLMGNYRWLESQARKRLSIGDRALELGAGSGDLARRFRDRKVGVVVDGLDLCPPPSDWDEARRWHQNDILRFEGYREYDAIMGNLIFHQFTAAELANLGGRLEGRARFLFACEPARCVGSLVLFWCLSRFGGMGRVSRKDGITSIRAGFLGEELAELLGLDRKLWRWKCRTGWRGGYTMVAWRIGTS